MNGAVLVPEPPQHTLQHTYTWATTLRFLRPRTEDHAWGLFLSSILPPSGPEMPLAMR